MNLLIFALFLGHLKRIEDESFVRNTINKLQPHVTSFIKYLFLYNN